MASPLPGGTQELCVAPPSCYVCSPMLGYGGSEGAACPAKVSVSERANADAPLVSLLLREVKFRSL